MLIAGLGAACSPILTADQIYQLALNAGFPTGTATTMTAIALRESAGCPNAHNPGPGEDSYGLWQINVQGNPGILSALGLSSPTQLYDPATNAAAAAYLWGGNDANLNVAWRANQPNYGTPGYTLADYLPIAQQAALDVSGVSPDGSGGGVSTDGLGAGQIALAAVVLVAAALLLT